jgi:hypothetical protein
VCRAPMPEPPIDEDRNPAAREYDVRPARKSGVQAVSEAQRPEPPRSVFSGFVSLHRMRYMQRLLCFGVKTSIAAI